MESSKVCRLCLCNSFDSIELFGEKGRELKIQSIVSQHFWFEPAEDDNFSNLICGVCWNSLRSFHDFYTRVKLAQDTLLNPDPQKGYLTECNIDIVKQEESLVKYEDNLSGDSLSKENADDLDDDKFDTSSDESVDIPTASLSSDSEVPIRRTTRKRKLNIKEQEENTTSPPKRRGRPPKSKSNENARSINLQPKALLTKEEKLKKKAKTEEEDQKIRDFFELACKLCAFRSISFVGVKDHYRRAHFIERGYITCCNRKFFERRKILEHVAWHSDPNSFNCPTCHKSYKDKRGLKVHMLLHADNDKRLYKCDLCEKSYVKKYHLGRHMRVRHIPEQMKIHKCPTCSKTFGTRSYLQIHIRGVHDFAYATICDICAKVFKSKAQCALHRRQHTEKKQKVQCTICESWYANEHGLYKHIQSTHNQTPQPCNICGKVSANRGALRSHIRYVHESERLHKCNICEKAFKKPLELKEHMASHTGGTLYVCSFCPKTFNSKANMHSHRKKMHPVEWLEDKERRTGPLPNIP